MVKKVVSLFAVAAVFCAVAPCLAAGPAPEPPQRRPFPRLVAPAARPPQPLPAPGTLPDYKARRVWVGKVHLGGGPLAEPLAGPAAAGDWVQLVCEYENAGSDASCATGGCAGNAVLSADGQQIASHPLKGSPAAQVTTATAPWRPMKAGVHKIACDLAPAAGTVEAQAGNNHAEGTVAVAAVVRAPLAGKLETGKPLDLIPPDLRVTALTVDDATCAVTAQVENAGGRMHHDALVRLFQGGVLAGVKLKECAWPQGVRSTICRGYCVYNQPYNSVRCTVPGDHAIDAVIVTNPAEKVASPATLHRQATLHARQDLAVEGLRADPLGRLSVAVRNRGLCDSGTWGIVAAANSMQFATGGTNAALVRNQQVSWPVNPPPPAGAGQIFVKVLPSAPTSELNAGNNEAVFSVATVVSGFDIVPVDIRLAGDFEPPLNTPWGNEAAYKVVPVVRNIGSADMPGMKVHYKIFIDGADANAIGDCGMGLDKGDELAWSSYCLTGVVIPQGQHEVQFVILTNDANVRNNSLTKTLYRP